MKIILYSVFLLLFAILPSCVSSKVVPLSEWSEKELRLRYPIYVSSKSYSFDDSIHHSKISDTTLAVSHKIVIPAGSPAKLVRLVWRDNISVQYLELDIETPFVDGTWHRLSGIIFTDPYRPLDIDREIRRRFAMTE